MIKRLLRDRHGISLAEVVITLALVMIVSTVAISLLISSVRVNTVYNNQYRAIMGCESAANCVRFADGDADLLREALCRVGFVEVSDHEFVLINGEYRVTVTRENGTDVVRYNGDCVYIPNGRKHDEYWG